MAAHSSVLAWRIPGTGEPGGLQGRTESDRTEVTQQQQQQQQDCYYPSELCDPALSVEKIHQKDFTLRFNIRPLDYCCHASK